MSLDKEADGMQNKRPIGSSQEAEECEQLDNLIERTTISGSNFVPQLWAKELRYGGTPNELLQRRPLQGCL